MSPTGEVQKEAAKCTDCESPQCPRASKVQFDTVQAVNKPNQAQALTGKSEDLYSKTSPVNDVPRYGQALSVWI